LEGGEILAGVGGEISCLGLLEKSQLGLRGGIPSGIAGKVRAGIAGKKISSGIGGKFTAGIVGRKFPSGIVEEISRLGLGGNPAWDCVPGQVLRHGQDLPRVVSLLCGQWRESEVGVVAANDIGWLRTCSLKRGA